MNNNKFSSVNWKKLFYLWQRYLFWPDMGDENRANYWLKRIEEFNKENNEQQ